jgi:integrase
VRFVHFSDLRHPTELGPVDVSRFLESLATERRVAASTLNQAHAALLFLYRDVLGEPARCPAALPRAQRRGDPPDVLVPAEMSRLLAAVVPAHRLVVSLLYGAGLRLMECLTLRVKDVDVARRRIHVREGKGGKGRFTVLPNVLGKAVVEQIERVRRLHGRDVQRGGGYVVLLWAFDRKSPKASRDWRRTWLFPASRQYVHG